MRPPAALAALWVLVSLAMAGMAANSQRVAEWVAGHGGTAVRDATGSIVEIDLSRSWVSDIDLEQLRGLDRLERLDLSQTHVTDAGIAVVAELPALRDLGLFFCEHVTDSGASALRRATGLRRLNVRGTKISDSGVKFLAELEELRGLDIGITEIGDSSVELLEALPRLESLAIGGNRVGEAGIASLRSLKRLRHLDLSGSQVTDSGIWAVMVTDLNLDEIAALAGLESLVLAAPSPEYVDAVSTGVPRLRGAIRVTDFGAGHLARMSALRKLDVTRSQLTAAGLAKLSALAKLEELVLSHSQSIDDDAGQPIATLPALSSLDVSFTRFGDEGLRALNGHPTLRRVVAVGTPLTDSAVAKFVASGTERAVLR